jgi:hypothetical protein
MTIDKKYIKLLEERVEELQQRLTAEEKKKAPSLGDNELAVKFIASQIQLNCSDKIPVTYRYTKAKCVTKATNSVKCLHGLSTGKITVAQEYLDYVKEAMKLIESE